jgi:hypothetical protein
VDTSCECGEIGDDASAQATGFHVRSALDVSLARLFRLGTNGF